MATTGLERAYETTKQVVTLSSGIIAFTVTFAKEFPGGVPWSLRISWVLYCLSVMLGVWTLLAITGTFDELDRGVESNPARANIRLPAMLMVLTFIGGVVATMWTGLELK
jgi:hypothetical protein